MSAGTGEPGPVPQTVSLALTSIGFFALAIAGLGIGSLITDADVIPIPGLGPLPGALGLVAAGAAFAGVTWRLVREARPRYAGVFATILATYLAYGLVTGFVALFAAEGIATALAVSGSLLVGWPGLVVAVAAGVAGWSAIALVRTRAGRPRWPWEDDADE
ncbi:hypothetical protein F6J84_02045 [Microbacterium caowuchunii]|uniref:hypothetical protein n=1 Tax=Microbacterium caowuchunii TaxID=2614638 RepID=UPI001244445A|nr:hypothetical protein [Microbacterium caowuchunii]QEV99015.1 hypothetical protein F6J84_02045 [Microbacterium caowuchunii]